MLSAVVPLYRKSAQAYAVGDVVLSANLPTWARLECITAGTTASVEPSFTGATAGQYITDGTAKWVVDDARDGTPVGRVVFDSILRPGYVRANGATITSASVNYPRLIAYLQANPSLLAADAAEQAANVGLFLYDSSTDTLTAPNYIDKVMEGAASVTELAAGLPNVTGRVGDFIGYANVSSAPFLESNVRSSRLPDGTSKSTSAIFIDMDLSTSNAIFGASNTVQMAAITGIPQLRY
jgi:hypothetical protein